MKITIRRAGEGLVIEGVITSSGGNGDGAVDLQVTNEDGGLIADLEMTVEDTLEIGALGFSGLADELRAVKRINSEGP